MSFFHWVSNAVKSAGRAAHSLTHLVSKASGAIGHALGKVPFVGKGLEGVYNLATEPFKIVDNLAGGERIDHVALGALKNNVAQVKAVAPYAQMVVSLIPGIGTGAGALLAGGLALANGQKITAAFVEGIKGAIPGGPLAKSLFDVGKSAIQGKPISEIGLAALPLDDTAKRALAKGLDTVKRIASGQRVDHVAFTEAKAALPPEARKALDIGIAVGHGQQLQKIIVKQAPLILGDLANHGIGKIAKDKILIASKNLVPSAHHGFDVGIGLMSHRINPVQFTSTRKALSAIDQKGFDLAVSSYIGRVTNRAPTNLSDAQRAGYYATKGMMGALPKQKTALMHAISKNPQAKAGATVAINQVFKSRKSLWQQIKEYFGVAA